MQLIITPRDIMSCHGEQVSDRSGHAQGMVQVPDGNLAAAASLSLVWRSDHVLHQREAEELLGWWVEPEGRTVLHRNVLPYVPAVPLTTCKIFRQSRWCAYPGNPRLPHEVA